MLIITNWWLLHLIVKIIIMIIIRVMVSVIDYDDDNK